MIGRITAFGFAAFFGTFTALAQEHEVVFSRVYTEGCLIDAASEAEQKACIGQSARACVEATSDSPQTITQVLCAMREREFWQARIDKRYRQLRQAFAETDAELHIDNTTPYPKGIALLELQAIWPSYRDQTCKFETALWGWGSTSGLEEVTCLMRMTAEHSLYLEQQPEGGF